MATGFDESLPDLALIGGAWTAAESGATFAVTDPSDGSELARVPRMGRAETTRAVDAAAAALGPWQALSGHERSELLLAWAGLLRERADWMASIVSREQGKPLAEALTETLNSVAFMQWYGEEAKRIRGDVLGHPSRDKRVVVIKQAVGVTAAITPWNWPIGMPSRKVASALAAGCTMVLKPAEQTPLASLALARLGIEAGLPDGVFNVVTGERADAEEIGAVFTGDPRVRQISFTGSTPVGKHLMQQGAAQVKRMTMELGGNAPVVVFDDADLDLAVEQTMVAKFRNAGQVCIAANRILVQDGIHDRFVEAFAARVAQLAVGPWTDPESAIGPLIDARALDKVQRHLDDAVSRGGRIVTGGAPHAIGGTFFEPTVLTGVDGSMAMSHEETFGPVAAIRRFSTEDEALRIANDTPFGLAAYLFTRDIGRAWRAAERLETGIVGINAGLISTETAPFGGVKESGIGREGSHYGLDEWLEIKYLCFGGVEAAQQDGAVHG